MVPSLLVAQFVLASIPTPPLVVLDAGHGGHHDGAVGTGGLAEKTVVLDIARRTRALLTAEGTARVHLTRIGDVDLDLVERVAQANARGAAVLISIHANATPRRRRKSEGIEVYFLSLRSSSSYAAEVASRENDLRHDRGAPARNRSEKNGALTGILDDLTRSASHEASSSLASMCHDHLVRATGAVARGVYQAPFVVLTGARMPAVLVEIGFIDHPEEGRELGRPSYRAAIARGLADAIGTFLAGRGRRRHLATAAMDLAP